MGRLRNKRTFIASDTVAAVAAKKSMSMLWNPASSGIYVVIHKIYAQLAAAGVAELKTHTATTGFTEDTAADKPTDVSGGASGMAKVYYDNEAAPGGTAYATFYVGTTATEIDLVHPIILDESDGLCINDPVVNQAMNVMWMYEEVPKPSTPSSGS